MSKNFEKWKMYYDKGYLSIDKLHNLIGKKYGITILEYKKIIGKEA